MKIVTASNGKKTVKISKKEWESLGKKAGWLDSKKENEENVDITSSTKTSKKDSENPCWDGYEMIGKKKKNGKEVPNCVPKKKASKEKSELEIGKDIEKEHKEIYDRLKKKYNIDITLEEFSEAIAKDHLKEDDEYYTKLLEMEKKFDKKSFNFKEMKKEAAEYKGKKVELNKPFRTPGGPKKFAVYVKNDKGNVIKVNFGDPGMEIKRDDPEAMRNFRARHDCKNKKDKTKAGYWSCRSWSKNAPWV